MSHDYSYERVVDRILDASRWPTEAELAESLGISQNTWTAYKQGKRSFGLHDITRICDVLGVAPHWLLFGDGAEMGSTPVKRKGSPATIQGGELQIPLHQGGAVSLVLIPRYQVAAAAGDGLIPVDELETVEAVALTRSFMRRIGANPEQSHIIAAKGDSMLPTIPDGSLLLVDRSRCMIVEGGVFVFRVGDGIKVKRASQRLDQRITLVSDNQSAGYPPETYTREELDTLANLGQVMCILRGP